MILTISNSNLDVVYHRCFFWPLVAASEDLALDLIKKQLKCLQLKPIED
jgi:hypothetical protein